jgi:hypothetical protein
MPNSQSDAPWSRHAARILRAMAALAVVLQSAGCALGTVSRPYPGADVDRLWECTVAVAQDPAVDQWHTVENNAWVSRGDRRVELMRVIERVLEQEGARPEYQRQTWSMTLRVLPAAPDGDPETGEVRRDPEVRIESRSSRPPAQFWIFGDAMLDAIDARLNDPVGRAAPPAPNRRPERAGQVPPGGSLQSP